MYWVSHRAAGLLGVDAPFGDVVRRQVVAAPADLGFGGLAGDRSIGSRPAELDAAMLRAGVVDADGGIVRNLHTAGLGVVAAVTAAATGERPALSDLGVRAGRSHDGRATDAGGMAGATVAGADIGRLNGVAGAATDIEAMGGVVAVTDSVVAAAVGRIVGSIVSRIGIAVSVHGDAAVPDGSRAWVMMPASNEC